MVSKDIINMYFKEISRFPLLTDEQIKELAIRIRKGDKEAENKLTQSCLRSVIWVIKKRFSTYLNQPSTFLDMIQEGNIGLCKAVKRIDPEQSKAFFGFATWWIWQEIARALNERMSDIHLPNYVAGIIKQYNKTRHQLIQNLKREPSSEEVLDKMEIPKKKMEKFLQLPRVIPLETHMGLNDRWDTKVLANLIPNEQAINPEKAVLEEERERELKKRIAKVISSLKSAIQEKVIRMNFGIGEEKDYNLSEIGRSQEFQFSREWIRQIKDKAMRKLQHPRRKRLLEEFAAK